MVKVCDAIMGNGKSSAAITYMNEHRGERFIYITPYLDEAARIRDGCPELWFVEPSDKIAEYGFKKSLHTVALIEEGRNISTTHQAFRGYTPDTIEKIRAQGYTLIIDENCDILEKYEIHPDDLKMAVEAGYVSDENGVYSLTGKEYKGTAFHSLFYTMQSRELIQIRDRMDNVFFYWTLSPNLITAFKDVFILTYLFDGQSLHHLLEIYSIPYERIGIHRDADGTYRFGSYPGFTPEYVHHLKEMIHILDNPKLNQVGDDYYALSKNWFERDGEDVDRLKNNVSNCFRNIWGDIPADQRLWGTYNGAFEKVRGKGYTKSFLTFNAKATNKYRDCCALVYISNIFMNAAERQFYQSHGIEVDQDIYALSIMVQWIWRSAIRDGKEVQLYIPSRRMREILERWIASFDDGEPGCHESGRPAEEARGRGSRCGCDGLRDVIEQTDHGDRICPSDFEKQNNQNAHNGFGDQSDHTEGGDGVGLDE